MKQSVTDPHNRRQSAEFRNPVPDASETSPPLTDFDEKDSYLHDARPLLPKAAFFMGDLRDGLPMINMQAAYLIISKDFSGKQVGTSFLAFGLSQFVCMIPAGYFLDYSNNKISWVNYISVAIAAITIISTVTTQEGGRNMTMLFAWRILQGGLTAVLPSGFNSITLGITGTKGFTLQVSRNRMMTHMGTSVIVAVGALIAYFSYPNIGVLFIVSPLAAFGVWHYLDQVVPNHVDRDAARALILESPTMTEYELADDVALCKQRAAHMLAMDSSGNEESRNHNSSEDEFMPSSDSSLNGSRGSTRQPPCAIPRRVVSPINVEAEAPRLPSGANMGGLMSSGLESPVTAQEKFYVPPNPTPPLRDSVIVEEEETASSNSVRSSSMERKSYSSMPSFNVGWGGFPQQQPSLNHEVGEGDNANGVEKQRAGVLVHLPPRARTPLAILLNPTLMLFTSVVFFFHLANSSVLPLVMQTLNVEDAQSSILLSSLCIMIAQAFMAFFAKLCGDYSPYWGRKNLMLAGFLSLTIRCFLLTGLVSVQNFVEEERNQNGSRSNQYWWLKSLILSTQFLDSIGAGIIGTLQILVTADISGGTGRFSLMMGVTTSAMCLGGTISGYMGVFLASDYGFPFAFSFLGLLSLVPFFLYMVFMPETMPLLLPQKKRRRRRRLRELLTKLKESTSQRWTSSRRGLSNLLITTLKKKKRHKNPMQEARADIAGPAMVQQDHVELV